MRASDRDVIRAALTGPIPSVRTPFLRDGAIDFRGLCNCLEFDLAAGAKTLLLTYGDSLHSVLTDSEIGDVAKAVVDQARGRAMVVAADRAWATSAEVDFARYAREIGADMLMVLPPDWAISCTVASLLEHYAAVATEIPVMMVTGILNQRSPAFAEELMDRVIRELPGVAAVKEDSGAETARRVCAIAGASIPVFAGGQKQNHLNIHPYGSSGYLSTFITFMPQISEAYWAAIQQGDLVKAVRIIRNFDVPFFDAIVEIRGGFDAAMHGILELCGLAERWRRKPYYSLTDDDMEPLKDLLDRLGSLSPTV